MIARVRVKRAIFDLLVEKQKRAERRVAVMLLAERVSAPQMVHVVSQNTENRSSHWLSTEKFVSQTFISPRPIPPFLMGTLVGIIQLQLLPLSVKPRTLKLYAP